MKTESEFSWFKILSIFGAGLAVFFAFINGGSGGILIYKGYGFNGAVTLISAVAWLGVAYLIYKHYELKTRAGKPGVKIEDMKKEDKA